MREINWDKIRETKSGRTPFALATGLYLTALGGCSVVAVTAYALNPPLNHEQKALAALDADKTTTDYIDLQPMP